MPDAALRRAADTGDAAESRACSRRRCGGCCAIRRSPALAEKFGGQWLQFRALESVTRNRERFPGLRRLPAPVDAARNRDCSSSTSSATIAASSTSSTRSYSFLNERLARHYGIAGVAGPEFRRVDLTGTPRGGVLTQASVLTVSSYATRTSPVLRGKWVLDNLLNAPPPDPPPDVPNLDEAPSARPRRCASSSSSIGRIRPARRAIARMDPLGFGLENFDAIGAWRDHGRQVSDRRHRARCRTATSSTGPTSCGRCWRSRPRRVRPLPDGKL